MTNDRPDRFARALGYVDEINTHGDLSKTLEHAADAIVMTDATLDFPGPTITYVNAAFEQLSGYDRSDLIGRSPRLLQGFDTDMVEIARMKRTLVAGESFEGAVLNYHRSGREYVMGWTIVPVRDGSGDIQRWLSIQSDEMAEARVRSS